MPETTHGPDAAERQQFVARLWRTAMLQVEDIERRLRADAQQPAESERDARTLAVLVKTLRELVAFDAAVANDAAKDAMTADDDTDPVPRDADELRRELARRIRAFVEERTAPELPGGAEG